MTTWWENKGRIAYQSLGSCVDMALEKGNAEIAIVCGLPLVKLAQAEGANYFGTEGQYNYNSAVSLARESVKLADKEGLPGFLEGDKREIEETLKGMGFYYFRER